MTERRIDRLACWTPAVVGAVLVTAASISTGCGGRHQPSPPRVWIEPSTGIEFLYVAPGRFRMGSPPAEPSRQDDEIEHDVELTHGFYLGRYEVTQGQWVEIMGDNPSQFPECGDRCPVETVSFIAIQTFIERLEERSPGNSFRLPTEAEWEYACRGGTETPFSTGGTITTDQANFDGRYPYGEGPTGAYRGSPAPVGSFPPNPWGFFDLHGNVWEWCGDWYGDYPHGPVHDPTGPPAGDLRVIRGGSWAFGADSARSALRYTHAPGDDGYSLGFRLVRDVAPP